MPIKLISSNNPSELKPNEKKESNEDNLNSLRLHLQNILEGGRDGFTINKELIEPSYNTYKEILAKYNIENNPQNKGTTIIPLDFSISMDGLSGILPHSAFIIPVNLLPSNYKTKNNLPKIAFILHKINQDFSNNKWITKISGQALNIRFDEEDSIEVKKDQPYLLNEKINNIKQHIADKATKRSSSSGLASGAVAADELYKKLGITLEQWNLYRNSIAYIESGGKYNVIGGSSKHYDGRYQMGRDAKKDGAKIANIPDPGHNAQQREKFRNDPALQEKLFTGFTIANHNKLMKNPIYKKASNERKLEILGYAHNQGAGGANNWVNTGNIRSDRFGTKGTKYTDTISNNFDKMVNNFNLENNNYVLFPQK
jgi:hypothetical protein